MRGEHEIERERERVRERERESLPIILFCDTRDHIGLFKYIYVYVFMYVCMYGGLVQVLRHLMYPEVYTPF